MVYVFRENLKRAAGRAVAGFAGGYGGAPHQLLPHIIVCLLQSGVYHNAMLAGKVCRLVPIPVVYNLRRRVLDGLGLKGVAALCLGRKYFLRGAGRHQCRNRCEDG